MPTLNWIGKDKVVNHHLDVPFCTLEKQYTYASEGRDDGDNMIIHGATCTRSRRCFRSSRAR